MHQVERSPSLKSRSWAIERVAETDVSFLFAAATFRARRESRATELHVLRERIDSIVFFLFYLNGMTFFLCARQRRAMRFFFLFLFWVWVFSHFFLMRNR